MWGSIHTNGLRAQENYAAALATFTKSKPWRGHAGPCDARPISQSIRAKKHMNVRMGGDGEIIFCLYNTDVLTFHKDGRIELWPHVSTSTNAFVNSLLPSGIRVAYNDNHNLVMVGRGYWHSDNPREFHNIKRGAIFERDDTRPGLDYKLADPDISEPFVHLSINKTLANKALKAHGFANFHAWLNVSMKMGLVLKGEGLSTGDGISSYNRHAAHNTMLAALVDRAQWRPLAASLFDMLPYELQNAPAWKYQDAAALRQARYDGMCAAMRQVIYKSTPDIIVRVEHKTVDNAKLVVACAASQRKYRWFS